MTSKHWQTHHRCSRKNKTPIVTGFKNNILMTYLVSSSHYLAKRIKSMETKIYEFSSINNIKMFWFGLSKIKTNILTIRRLNWDRWGQGSLNLNYCANSCLFDRYIEQILIIYNEIT